jgi:hypothetical protein
MHDAQHARNGGERENQNIIGGENIHKYAQMREALKKKQPKQKS